MRPGYRRDVRNRASRPKEQIYAVTGLPESLQDDRNARMHRYLWSMGIRTACFVLAVFALGVLRWTVVGWGLVIAAVILPYVAVVVANAAKPRASSALGPVTTDTAPDSAAAPQLAPRRPDEVPSDEEPSDEEPPDDHGRAQP